VFAEVMSAKAMRSEGGKGKREGLTVESSRKGGGGRGKKRGGGFHLHHSIDARLVFEGSKKERGGG